MFKSVMALTFTTRSPFSTLSAALINAALIRPLRDNPCRLDDPSALPEFWLPAGNPAAGCFRQLANPRRKTARSR
jgi:hypothetical protein